MSEDEATDETRRVMAMLGVNPWDQCYVEAANGVIDRAKGRAETMWKRPHQIRRAYEYELSREVARMLGVAP